MGHYKDTFGQASYTDKDAAGLATYSIEGEDAIEDFDFLPKVSITFELDSTQFTAERSKYTFFILLGDLGGFNGAIMILPAYLMSMYTDRMFKQSMT